MNYQTIITFLDDPSSDDGTIGYVNRLEVMASFLSAKRTPSASNPFAATYQEWQDDKWLTLFNRVDALLSEHYDSDDDSWVIGLGDAPIY